MTALMLWNQTLNFYLTDVYCLCPRCSACAIARAPRSRYEMPWQPASARVTCTRCSFVASNDSPAAVHIFGVDVGAGRLRSTASPSRHITDPYFGLPLFLVTTCRSHTLFAINPTHVRDIRAFLSLALRPRPANTKWSMVNRLPHWLKLARNRSLVLRALRRLELRAEEPAPAIRQGPNPGMQRTRYARR